MDTKRTYRIGCGAGFSTDRLEPAVELVNRGGLDAIIFECLAERTLAFGHRDRIAGSGRGYNPLLERRMNAVLAAARANGTRIVTNMGVANPVGAAEKTLEIARRLGLKGLRIAALEGDDVSGLMTPDTALPEAGLTVGSVGRRMVGANAYLGADAILPALAAGADVVITGRVADPSLVLAPLRHAFGWAEDDWEMLGRGTVAGHLLECGAQVTGGYFADPGYKEVPNVARLGYPLAEVEADGSLVITKLDGTGGLVSPQTVKEQLLYEVHDPAGYLTPDVTADFSGVGIAEVGHDRIRVSGGTGRARPDTLKVTVAFDGGMLAEAGASYAGPGAVERARLAGRILEERMREVHGLNAPLRIDLIGVSSLHGSAVEYPSNAQDVRLHAAMRASSREEAEVLLWEMEAMLIAGPAGGGGYRGHLTPSVMTYSAYVDRTAIVPKITWFEA